MLIRRGNASFKASDLVITKAKNLRTKPSASADLEFGKQFTDHMFKIVWTKADGWGTPEIKPYESFQLDPTAGVFHYANSCFEGLKAYKNEKGQVITFRANEIFQRMNKSAKSVILPTFNENELIGCMNELLRVDHEWILPEKGFSCYIRAAEICIHKSLGVSSPEEAQLFIVMSSMAPFHAKGFSPISLYTDENIVKAYPGGTGEFNIGGNYGPVIKHIASAQAKGYEDILWLLNREISMAGVRNFFTLQKTPSGKTELVTPKLDSTILPGLTRDSLITMANGWGDFEVSERTHTIDELVGALKDKRVLECFATATDAVVQPIKTIHFEGEDHEVPCEVDGKVGKVAKRFHDELLAIQYGDVEHEWQNVVEI